MSAEALEILFSEQEYFPVAMTTLSHRKIAFCDMYVRLPSNRMIRVAHRDGPIDLTRFNRLMEKTDGYIFVHKSDFGSVVSELVRGAEDLISSGSFTAEQKIAKCFSITECVCAEFLSFEVNEQSMARAVHMSKGLAQVLRMKPNFGQALKLTFTIKEECTRNAMMTVLMSNLIATQLDWKSDKTLDALTFGAFIRDIGLRDLPTPLRTKDPSQMTPEELALYRQHPTFGAKILSSQSFISGEVVKIVQEHHEVPNGTGFPSSLRGERISPLAKVVSFSEMLSHDILDSVKAGQPFSVPGMLKKLDDHYTVVYGIELAKAARKIFKS